MPSHADENNLVMDADVSITLTSATDGDFASWVRTSSGDGCKCKGTHAMLGIAGCGKVIRSSPLVHQTTDAHNDAVTVTSGAVATGAILDTVASYRLCYATAASGGDEEADFVEQGFIITVVGAASTSQPQPVNAKTTAIAAGAATELTTTAANGDFVALVPTTNVNCAGEADVWVVVLVWGVCCVFADCELPRSHQVLLLPKAS